MPSQLACSTKNGISLKISKNSRDCQVLTNLNDYRSFSKKGKCTQSIKFINRKKGSWVSSSENKKDGEVLYIIGKESKIKGWSSSGITISLDTNLRGFLGINLDGCESKEFCSKSGTLVKQKISCVSID